MEFDGSILRIDSFIAVTIGIIVLFVGKRLNDNVGFLREYSIPEPVTGGLLFSILFGLVYWLLSVQVEFNLAARDLLLVYFFTTIGINSSVRDLIVGGRPLMILLLVTIGFMVAQNFVGIGGAWLFGLPSAVGVVGGTVSLIGGHGTTIAWAPQIAENFGISNAMEIGIASATIGLILASLIGGPMAKFLINRHKLQPDAAHIHDAQDVGVSRRDCDKNISHLDFLNTILAIHIAIIIGVLLNEFIGGDFIDQPAAARFFGQTWHQVADPCPGNGLDCRRFSRHVPRHVLDEYAALDAGRSGRAGVDHSGLAVGAGSDGGDFHPVPLDGKKL